MSNVIGNVSRSSRFIVSTVAVGLYAAAALVGGGASAAPAASSVVLEEVVVIGKRETPRDIVAPIAQLEEVVVWGQREPTERVADNNGGGVTQSASQNKPLLARLRSWIGGTLLK